MSDSPLSPYRQQLQRHKMMKLILSIALFVVVVAEARNLPNDDANNDHRCHHCNTRQERSAPASSGEIEESSSKGHHSDGRKHNTTMSEGEQKPWQGTSHHSVQKRSAPARSTKVHHSGDRHGSKSGGVPEPRHGASHIIQARSAPHCHHCGTREERSAPSTDSGSDENTSGSGQQSSESGQQSSESGQQSSESGTSKEGSSEEKH